MAQLFQNFTAAERKRHMSRFYLFPANMDLSWIDEIPLGAGGAPVYLDLTSLVNGSNLVFPLSSTPANADSVIVALNGQLMKRGTDYTLSGTTLTMLVAPQVGDSLVAYVWV